MIKPGSQKDVMLRLLQERGTSGATAWDFTHECRVMQYNRVIKLLRDEENCVIECLDETNEVTGKVYGRFILRGIVKPGEQARLQL